MVNPFFSKRIDRVNTPIGIVLKILAALCTVMMGACIAGLAGAIPVGEVVFFRSLGAFLPLVLLMIARGRFRQEIATRHIGGHIIRSASGTGGMFFSFLALIYLPLVDATALAYAAPLFTVFLAAVLLKEVVGVYRWSAVCVGLIGVLVMLAHDASWGLPEADLGRSGVWMGGAFGLTAAFFTAISTIQIRHLARTENPGAIVFYFSLVTTLIGLSTIGLGWAVPDRHQLFLLVGAGIAGGMAQLLITTSLRHAQASFLAPFDYTTMIWALAMGYFFMGQVPAANTLVGATMVIAAGLFTLFRENQLRRRSLQAQLAPAAFTDNKTVA